MQLPTEQQLTQMTLDHWRQNNPEMYAGLKAEHKLHARAREAARMTLESVQQLVDGGMSTLEAWAMMRHEYCLIEAEDEQEEMKYGPEEPEPETEEYGWIPLMRNPQSPAAADPSMIM